MQFSENKDINVDIFDCHLDVLPECIDDEYPHEAFQVSLVPVPHHTLVGLILLHQGPNHSAQVLSTQALYKTVKYLLNLLAFSFYLSSFVCFYFLPFLQVIITHLANNKNWEEQEGRYHGALLPWHFKRSVWVKLYTHLKWCLIPSENSGGGLWKVLTLRYS